MIVYLLRHGEAEPYLSDTTDRDRVLMEYGLFQAKAAGAFLRDQTIKPKIILCSPYKRTQETASLANSVLGASVKIDDRLAADQSASSILEVVSEQSHRPSAVIISHNPIISRVVDILLHGASSSPTYSLNTGELVGIEIPPADGLNHIAGQGKFFTRFRFGE